MAFTTLFVCIKVLGLLKRTPSIYKNVVSTYTVKELGLLKGTTSEYLVC